MGIATWSAGSRRGSVPARLAGSVRVGSWRHFDLQLLLYVALLTALGVAMGYAAGFGEAATAGELPQTTRTLVWAAIGFTLLFVVAGIDYSWLRSLAAVIYLVVIGLLLLTLAIGTSHFGARLSVSVGGLDFQFSEIGKVLMVAVLAAFLAARGERVARLSTVLLAAGLVVVPAALVVRQPDLGTALVFAAAMLGMLFVAGAGIGWLAIGIGSAFAAAPVIVSLLQDYQRQRLLCFLDPYADPQGACYQLVQALNAVGSGGVLGRGLTVGAEDQRGYVPVQSTDFVFTVLAEDLGLVGGVLMLALFGLLLWRILRIGWESRDTFGALVATGLASVILFQVVVNVGMVLGVMPVIGIPLPFISYGGSSLVSLLFGIGILESIRMRSQRRDL